MTWQCLQIVCSWSRKALGQVQSLQTALPEERRARWNEAVETEREARSQAEGASKIASDEIRQEQNACWQAKEASENQAKAAAAVEIQVQEYQEINQVLKDQLSVLAHDLQREAHVKKALQNALKLVEARYKELESIIALATASDEKQIRSVARCILQDRLGFTPAHDVKLLEVGTLGYTHDTIAPKFQDGRLLDDLVNDLLAGHVDPERHPNLVLDVVYFRGRYLSLNNRRLWALKQYQQHLAGPVAGKNGRSHSTTIRVHARVFHLCPITAKFMLSNTNRMEGAIVERRRSVSRQPFSTSGRTASTDHVDLQARGLASAWGDTLQTEQEERIAHTAMQVPTMAEEMTVMSAVGRQIEFDRFICMQPRLAFGDSAVADQRNHGHMRIEQIQRRPVSRTPAARNLREDSIGDRGRSSGTSEEPPRSRWGKEESATSLDAPMVSFALEKNTASSGSLEKLVWEKDVNPNAGKQGWWHPIQQQANFQEPHVGVQELSEVLDPQNITTLMIRNLPSSLSQDDFLDDVNASGFLGTYDFAYLPQCFDRRQNKGFAFINFMTASTAVSFVDCWHKQHRSGKTTAYEQITISPATTQGFAGNIQKWTGARLRRIKDARLHPFVLDQMKDAGPNLNFPTPTVQRGLPLPIGLQ